MNAEKIEKLLGTPWRLGGCGSETFENGLKAFDCWGLLRHVFMEERGIVLKHSSALETLNVSEYSKIIEEESKKWDELLVPIHLCAVAMSRNRFLQHVGVYVDIDGGLILHSEQGRGVVVETETDLRNNGFKKIKFYDYSS